MNARISLVTATLTLSLIVPSGASALRGNIPADASLSKQAVSARHTLELTSSAIGLGAYNTWAPYVHGGASQKVANAISVAAKPRTANPCVSKAQRRVPC